MDILECEQNIGNNDTFISKIVTSLTPSPLTHMSFLSSPVPAIPAIPALPLVHLNKVLAGGTSGP